MLASRRSTRQARQVVLAVSVFVLIYLFLLRSSPSVDHEAAFLRHHMNADPPEHTLVESSFDWSWVKFAHVPPPLDPPAPPLQTRRSPKMPRIQHVFTDDDEEETQAAAMLRESRRRKVRDVLARDWQSYRAHAWLQPSCNAALLDTAWAMFETVANGTAAGFGHGAVKEVTVPQDELVREDYMEGFWLAETLKYFYLVLSPPDVISLDEFVLNTEAHPLRMPS
ncbi:hypothetical protein VD0004_g9791 [Verticillium dahliae]|uniref:Uncharacterized protein n=1 Tax=Verticillium dahliae TaxID=27337 RepID=A0A444RYG6_VERDA|nr:hypothetical protein VD0004_g9791 [Verticillium dahliae]PNH61630.1 hypothetical protein VD0001_g9655 [Verticillium dahliae]RXG46164.1 hypothetical protein VDGE_03410 [Verticillium dahliae]